MKLYLICGTMARHILGLPACSTEAVRVHSQARTVLNWNLVYMVAKTFKDSGNIKRSVLFNRGYGNVISKEMARFKDPEIGFDLTT